MRQGVDTKYVRHTVTDLSQIKDLPIALNTERLGLEFYDRQHTSNYLFIDYLQTLVEELKLNEVKARKEPTHISFTQ